MEILQTLNDAHLAALAAGLRTGRLSPPYSSMAVQRFCENASVSVAVASHLQQLATDGFTAQHLALLIETIVRTRSNNPTGVDLVDLVWTGPETMGVANRDTGVVVRDLFGSAEKEVLVAGFAVYQGRDVFHRLAERMTELSSLKVHLFLDIQRTQGDTSTLDQVVQRFVSRFRAQEWPGDHMPSIYFDPRSIDHDGVKRSSLHAKCIVIDRKTALVTSANFTEAAQNRNIEVGALIRSERFAERLASHFLTLADAEILRRATP